MIEWNRRSIEEGGLLPLYCKYSGQHKPQPAFLYLAEDGEAGFGYNPAIGGAPTDVWHGRMLTWDVSPYLTASQLDEIVGDEEVNALLAEIHSGHTVEWDGRNMHGYLTDEAEDVSFDLQALLDNRYGEGNGIVIDDPHDAAGGNTLVELFINGGYSSVSEFFNQEFPDGGLDGVTVYDFNERHLEEKLVEDLENELENNPDAWEKWPDAMRKLAVENGLIENEGGGNK